MPKNVRSLRPGLQKISIRIHEPYFQKRSNRLRLGDSIFMREKLGLESAPRELFTGSEFLRLDS